MLEHKAVPVGGVEVIDREQGIVRTIVSVTGLEDRVHDVIEPGSYTKTLKVRTPKGIWHHDWKMPVSRTVSIKELLPGDPGLPKTLPDGSPWPEEAGALEVVTQFNLKGERGRQAFADVEFFGDEQEWCADVETEILTDRGWLRYDEVTTNDRAYVLDTEYGAGRFEEIEAVNVFDAKPRPLRLIETGGHSSFTTAAHRWPVQSNADGGRPRWTTTEDLGIRDRIIRAAPRSDAPVVQKFSDAFVELVGWFWTEGWVPPADHSDAGLYLAQSVKANPQHVASIRAALDVAFPGDWSERHSQDEMARFRLTRPAAASILAVTGADKEPSHEFILGLTRSQLLLLIETCLSGDGNRRANGQRNWYQVSQAGIDAFEMVCALAGQPTNTKPQKDHGNRYGRPPQRVALLRSGVANPLAAIKTKSYGYKGGEPRTLATDEWTDHDGIVWCPTTPSRTWLARRKGTVYFTGNSVGYQVPKGKAVVRNGTRYIKEMDLFEYSPVLFGAMPHARTIESIKDAQEAWGEVKSAIYGTCGDGKGLCCVTCGSEAKGLDAGTVDGDRWVIDFGEDAPEGVPSVVGTFATKDAAVAWLDAGTDLPIGEVKKAKVEDDDEEIPDDPDDEESESDEEIPDDPDDEEITDADIEAIADDDEVAALENPAEEITLDNIDLSEAQRAELLALATAEAIDDDTLLRRLAVMFAENAPGTVVAAALAANVPIPGDVPDEPVRGEGPKASAGGSGLGNMDPRVTGAEGGRAYRPSEDKSAKTSDAFPVEALPFLEALYGTEAVIEVLASASGDVESKGLRRFVESMVHRDGDGKFAPKGGGSGGPDRPGGKKKRRPSAEPNWQQDYGYPAPSTPGVWSMEQRMAAQQGREPSADMAHMLDIAIVGQTEFPDDDERMEFYYAHAREMVRRGGESPRDNDNIDIWAVHDTVMTLSSMATAAALDRGATEEEARSPKGQAAVMLKDGLKTRVTGLVEKVGEVDPKAVTRAKDKVGAAFAGAVAKRKTKRQTDKENWAEFQRIQADIEKTLTRIERDGLRSDRLVRALDGEVRRGQRDRDEARTARLDAQLEATLSEIGMSRREWEERLAAISTPAGARPMGPVAGKADPAADEEAPGAPEPQDAPGGEPEVMSQLAIAEALYGTDALIDMLLDGADDDEEDDDEGAESKSARRFVESMVERANDGKFASKPGGGPIGGRRRKKKGQGAGTFDPVSSPWSPDHAWASGPGAVATDERMNFQARFAQLPDASPEAMAIEEHMASIANRPVSPEMAKMVDVAAVALEMPEAERDAYFMEQGRVLRSMSNMDPSRKGPNEHEERFQFHSNLLAKELALTAYTLQQQRGPEGGGMTGEGLLKHKVPGLVDKIRDSREKFKADPEAFKAFAAKAKNEVLTEYDIQSDRAKAKIKDTAGRASAQVRAAGDTAKAKGQAAGQKAKAASEEARVAVLDIFTRNMGFKVGKPSTPRSNASAEQIEAALATIRPRGTVAPIGPTARPMPPGTVARPMPAGARPMGPVAGKADPVDEAFLWAYKSLMDGGDDEVESKRFDPQDHPRGPDGKFVRKGGASQARKIANSIGRVTERLLGGQGWSPEKRRRESKRYYHDLFLPNAIDRERRVARHQNRKPSNHLAKINAAIFAAGGVQPKERRDWIAKDLGLDMNDLARSARRDIRQGGGSPEVQERLLRNLDAHIEYALGGRQVSLAPLPEEEKAALPIDADPEWAWLMDDVALDIKAASMTEDEVFEEMAALSPEDLETLISAVEAKVDAANPGTGEFRARHLIRWFERGEGAAKIRWGTKGDFGRCVRIASKHMRPDQAKGFCNLRHQGATGHPPGKGPHVGGKSIIWPVDLDAKDFNPDYGKAEEGTEECLFCEGSFIDAKGICPVCETDYEAKGVRRFVEQMVRRDNDGKFSSKPGGGGARLPNDGTSKRGKKPKGNVGAAVSAGLQTRKSSKKKGKAPAANAKDASWLDTLDVLNEMAADRGSLLHHLVDEGLARRNQEGGFDAEIMSPDGTGQIVGPINSLGAFRGGVQSLQALQAHNSHGYVGSATVDLGARTTTWTPSPDVEPQVIEHGENPRLAAVMLQQRLAEQRVALLRAAGGTLPTPTPAMAGAKSYRLVEGEVETLRATIRRRLLDVE